MKKKKESFKQLSMFDEENKTMIISHIGHIYDKKGNPVDLQRCYDCKPYKEGMEMYKTLEMMAKYNDVFEPKYILI